MRLAIIGSRNCPPIDIASYISARPATVISGGATGADTYAKDYAVRNNIPITEFLPEYKKYGRKAPLMRNIQIVDNCDSLLSQIALFLMPGDCLLVGIQVFPYAY